ncbi:D-erythrulose reductase-like [Mytilus californianus]|uniref:D-erythrulose reductase-like n=1 Tax=Mytilus californianus TaxID=6549 RepID=UPI002247C7D9|nr:D-erythrulose reductase-like [Mytilus californianus]
MAIRFDGKRALVTGAGKGFGRAIAKKLAECGAETFALSRTQADLDSLISEVPNINVINVDLQDWYKSRQEVSKIGHIDLLVNNAGVTMRSLFIDTPKENIDRIFDINFKGTFNVSQVIAKRMIQNGKGGRIVNISSILSEKAISEGCVYSTTKAAIDMLTKCMALELGPHNIRVNSINPTVVWTDMSRPYKEELMPLLPMTPMGRFPEIEDVVNTVVFLLSDQSGMISGESLRVDGGLGVH